MDSRGMRLGRLGLDLIHDNHSFGVPSLVLLTGHLRAFMDAAFQDNVVHSWRQFGFKNAPVALHTWDEESSVPTWWTGGASYPDRKQQAAQAPLDHIVANGSLRALLLAYEVQQPLRAAIRSPDIFSVAAKCESHRDLETAQRMLQGLNAQWYALHRVRWLIERALGLSSRRPEPSAVVLKTRPDAILLWRNSSSSLFLRRASAALRDDTRQIWTCKGWHALGVSDIAFVTSYEAVSALARAYDLCYVRLLEAGALRCSLLNKPEVVLKVFLDALGFTIHNGAFNVQWCRSAQALDNSPMGSCLHAGEHYITSMDEWWAKDASAAVELARACIGAVKR